jgi:hypothetical protein
VIAFFLTLSTATLASAQVLFRATLTGDAETPPVTTKASGWATFVLNSDQTLTYFVNTQGLTGSEAHIHEGPPGSSGPIVFTLDGGPDIYSGKTTALSSDQVDTLRARDLYVDVHTAAFTDGEIRGQIQARPVLFGAHLTGDHVVPPVSTSALGDLDVTVNADSTVTYTLTTTGLTGTGAEIRIGTPGNNGDLLFTLSGGPTTWSGTTTPMSARDFSRMQQLGLYANVLTAAYANGEIRGQIVRSLSKYGDGSEGSAGLSSLFGYGAPTPGGTITVKVNNGLPSGSGFLVLSTKADAVSVFGCPYYLGPPQAMLAVDLDGSGQIKASLAALPNLPSFDLYLQFFGMDTAAPNGAFYCTNGLHVPFTNY